MTEQALEDVWRRESPHVLGALLRRYDDFADCEDAAQEALLAATQQWPSDGVPANPRGWLIRVAQRKLVDQLRSDAARERRETADATARHLDVPAGPQPSAGADDSLQLMLLCCDPALSHSSQVALTLRCVAGLSTDEIAAAYLVPASTMGQRLSRARATLRQAGARFAIPSYDELPARVAAVLDVCHLIFTEGHTRTAGERLVGAELAGEAIRLTRMLRAAVPDNHEVTGALALMLLTHARAAARTDADGDLVSLERQDRSRWDPGLIAEGTGLLEDVLPRGHVGRYQLQAAIAAVHAEAASYADTDWPQISVLYGMLDEVAPSPAVTLNRAVAVGMTLGPEHGIAMVRELLKEPSMRRHHRTHAVLAHLLDQYGDQQAALEHYRQAARLTASQPEQRYLNLQLARLQQPGAG